MNAKKFLPRRRTLLLFGAAMLVLWVLLPLTPEEWGFRLGRLHSLFITLLLLVVIHFFALAERLLSGEGSHGGPSRTALAGVATAFAVAVGVPLAIGVAYPQFEVPRPAETAVVASPEERGKGFFQSPATGCFACHSIATEGIRGGERGPDLSGVGGRATTRVPGTAAGDYLTEHIKRGSDASFFVVQGYPPIMPPFGQRLKKEEIDDLVAFLLSLEGNVTK